MKFTLQVVAIIITAYILELFLPWYSIAIAAFIFGYLLRSDLNFLAGFIAIGFLWFVKAALIDSASTSLLADQVAQIFPLKQKVWLYLVTVVLGGLVGGFAAMTGAALGRKKSALPHANYH